MCPLSLLVFEVLPYASSSPAGWARGSSSGSGTRRPSLFGSSDLCSGVSCHPPRVPYFWVMLCAATGPRLADALSQEWPHPLCPQNSAWGSPGFSRSLHKGHVLSETVPLSQPKAHLLTLSWEFRSAFESALYMSRCVVDNCLVSVSPAPRERGAASPLHPAAIQAHWVAGGYLGGKACQSSALLLSQWTNIRETHFSS